MMESQIPEKTGKRKIIIDTDVGVDDAVAILMCIRSDEVEVVGITCCQGNVDIDTSMAGARFIVHNFAPYHIPVYRGAREALVGVEVPVRWSGHGANGLGDVDISLPESATRDTPKEHAALALSRLIRKYSGNVDVLAIGPLTNLALALKLDPECASHVGRIWVMGGSLYGRGSANRTAGFNFASDPEAAHIVFEAFFSYLKVCVTREPRMGDGWKFVWSRKCKSYS
eukprot:895744_1